MTIEFKPGDRVKCVAWAGALYTPGYVYTVQPGGILEGNDGRSFSYPLEQPFNGDRRFTLHAKAGEFAVGDKVVSIKTVGPWLTAGKVYEVHRVLDGHVHISGHDSSDEPSCFYNSRFRLATPEEIAAAEKSEGGFMPGDLVECVEGDSCLTVGARYVVRECNPNWGAIQASVIYVHGCFPPYYCTNFRLISRPNADGWHDYDMAMDNPLPGARMVVRNKFAYSDKDSDERDSEAFDWNTGITRFKIVPPAATPAPTSIPEAEEAAPTYKRGDQVLARVTLFSDIDEDGDFDIGSAYIKPSAIVGFDTTPKPLTVGDMASDGYFTGLIVFQRGDESVVEDACDGLVVRKTCDLVRA